MSGGQVHYGWVTTHQRSCLMDNVWWSSPLWLSLEQILD